MNPRQFLILLALFFSLACSSQTENLTIESNLDNINRTKVCTEFQRFHCIESCTAKLSSDTLIIRFHSETVSTFDDLTVWVVANKVHTAYKTVYFYQILNEKNEWLPLNQSVHLNSNKFLVGKKIKGFINAEFQEIYTDKNGEKEKTSIIKFAGQFVARIK